MTFLADLGSSATNNLESHATSDLGVEAVGSVEALRFTPLGGLPHAAGMPKSANKRLSNAYAVVAVLTSLTMFISASGKLTLNPGAVHVIHDVVGVPMVWFPALAACEIAGGLGLLAGILRPKLGVAAGIGLVLYFVGAIVGHVAVGDWAGLKAPITPFALACTVLVLRVRSMRQESRPVQHVA